MPQPDLNLKHVFDRLFARRADKPLVFGEALVRKPEAKADAGLPSPPPAASLAGLPSALLSRILAMAKRVGRGPTSMVIGVDLGSSAIKMVRVDRSGGTPKVVGLVCEEYPPHSEGKAQEAFIQTRFQELKRQGFLDGQLVFGVANSQLAVELVTLPKMPMADLSRAVSWEAKERLAADVAAYSIRHLLLGETATDGQPQYEILIIAAPREDIVSQWRTFSSQGFRIVAVEPGILASVEACEEGGMWRPQEFVGLLEIGRRASTLALLVQGVVRFVRSFPIAGDSITQSIVDYCQTNFEAAETQKRDIGLSQMALEEDRRIGTEADPRVRVSHALGLYLERLSAEIDHSLRYFTFELGQAKDRRFDCLYLVGGGALLKNFAPFLSSRVNARVEVINPFERCQMTDDARRQLGTNGTGTRLSAALGLALRPIK